MKFSNSKLGQAVVMAVAVFGASAAMAQTVVGGGSSLVAPTVGSEITAVGGGISYASVGSGKGIAGFLANDASQFGTGLTGPVHFANSDSALTTSQTDVNGSYARSSTDGRLIQLPYIVTPITIPYVNQPSDITASISLNDGDLCGIFSGKITNWNQVVNPVTNAPYTSTNAPITVVYRADGSGTSDLLTRHLSAVCSSANSNVTFNPTQTFASNFSGGVPSNFVAATGSGGVASNLVSLRTAGTAAIGYLSPDYTNTTLAPSSAPAASNQLTVANLRNAQGQDVAPTYQNATAALATAQAPTQANEGNPFAWVPLVPNPTAGYPISGTSNIVVSQCYTNKRVIQSKLVSFLTNHYTNASFASIVNGNGFDTVPASFSSLIASDILSNGNGLNLNIGNTTACGSLGR
ncbi:substrate-binding domain-containing protein [Burkholderia sp. FERM BP-3421]|jgi:ABC-type phosphate transport system substrate-binding protein|uniref:substrate-binding domain-containing protein n=1 Tax=Burkholderia sp. FERM BP-3421 TaxID=1494466 RepID=UPI002360EFC0|nr:substrate-binding domain-containing protein [Burkholderia sp. FERM BP-3421]WDD91354.1 substrate-binding domain-containing protein [Burkholderia sp. FERM BP-3421]